MLDAVAPHPIAETMWVLMVERLSFFQAAQELPVNIPPEPRKESAEPVAWERVELAS